MIFSFAGIFAAKVFEFSTQDVLMFAIAVNFTCGVGSLIGGWFDDRLGSFNTIRVSLIFNYIWIMCYILLEFRSSNWNFYWASSIGQPVISFSSSAC